jgi:hypothetical protein
VRGPETVSLLQRWKGPETQAQSLAVSFTDGWAWLARTADGQRFTQVTVAADAADFPKKPALRDYFLQQLAGIEEAEPFTRDASMAGELVARSSTAVLHPDPLQQRLMRVGDAAMASDPLSGNGIFNALSTALVAPSIINTIIQSPQRAELAERFYNDRLEHTFQRFARIGRDFYALEQRWPDHHFWRKRARWPDQEPAHGALQPNIVGMEQKPVVDTNQITLREVVVTSDQPLGVWHVAGVELAPLVRELIQAPPHQNWQQYLPEHGVSAEQLAALTAWLLKYQVIPPPGG